MSTPMSNKNPTLVRFGQAIREERRRANLSQEKLAELADVHRTYIGMVERAERNITLLNIEKLSKALGVPMSKIIRQLESYPQ